MVGYSPEEEVDGRRHLTKVDYGLAGAISAAFTRACLQPLDVVKIRFQLQEEPVRRGLQSSKYGSIIQAAGTIFREEGLGGFWKGHVPAQALSVVNGITQFVTFEAITYAAHPLLPSYFTTGDLKPVYHFLCGGLSGCAATFTSLPMDVLRTRLVSQGEPKVYLSTRHAVKSMFQEGGVRTFYKGLSPNLIQLFPQSGLQYGFYAFFKKTWKTAQEATKFHGLSGFESLLCGGMAGVCAKTVVYPLDVCKKRLQVQGFEEARRQFGRTSRYHSLRHCASTVVKNEGIRGIFKGLSPSLLKAFCSLGLIFASYEKSCKVLAQINR